MKDSLKWLLSKFPYFLDKSNGSNFYKSSSVINDSFKEFRQDLFNTHLSHRLDKRVLVWKEQEVDNDYTMNFYVHLPYLKMVNVYKNNSLIYSESYEYADEVDTFVYSYDDTSNKVIPEDKFHVTVETWEEYVLSKGFPENDTPQEDIYDHDKSLDELGALYDIPRKNYVYTPSTNPGNTEPPYNNRLTEDDYHYMNRILGYISHMQDTPLPVLEVWKLFGIPLDHISLVNRERYLCKMYSKEKHGGDNWTPKPWEHKDTMSCFWPEQVFFFVEVDNHSPVYGQSINFSFTFMNMFGEDKGTGYLIDVYLDGDLIKEEVDPLSKYSFSTVGVDDTYPLTFKFVANPLDERYEVLESDDIIINIKGCNTGDWYVATDGNDSNPGTNELPFKTVHKALSMVEGSQSVIVLKSGTFPLTGMEIIDNSTSIISCQGATIRNDSTYDFFRVLQGYSLYLQGITLKHKCCEMYASDDAFVNSNYTDNPLYLRVNPEIMCKPGVLLRLDSVNEKIYAHRNFTVESTLLNKDTLEGVPDEVIQLIKDNTVIDVANTDENGEFSFVRQIDSVGVHSFVLNHEESTQYCMGDNSFNVTVEAMPTTLTAAMDSTVCIGEELTIAFDLTDYYGDNVTYGYIKLLEEGIEVACVPADEEIEYTPLEIGDYDYQLVFVPADDSYIASESEVFYVTVRKFESEAVVTVDTDVCLPDDPVTIEIILTDENGNPISGAEVTLYDGDTIIWSGTTDEDGVASYTDTFDTGKHNFHWEYTGSETISGDESGSYTIVVKDPTPSIILELFVDSEEEFFEDAEVPLKVKATDSNGDPVSTSFYLTDTASSQCNQVPTTTYTTGNDGWWSGDYYAVGLIECLSSYIQAVSSVDELIMSNSVFVRGAGKYPSSLTFITSSNGVSVGESFTLSGRLLSEKVRNLPVKIYKGNSLLTTVNASGDGAFSYTLSESGPGDFIYKAVFDGNRTHEDCESSTVTVSVGKHASSITLLSSSQTPVLGDSFTLAGKLTTMDISAGTVVKIYNGSTLVDTVSVDNNGDYSKTLTPASPGTYNYKTVFEGDSTHANCESSVVPVHVSDYSLNVSASDTSPDPDDVVTITAVLLDNGSPVSGETVTFNVNGTISTDVTDSNGEATATYTANGLRGDVNVTASAKGITHGIVIHDDGPDFEVLASDLTKYDGGSEQFVVTVREYGEPASGKSVTITVNGYPYNRTTGNDGTCGIGTNFTPGVYPVTVTCEDVTISRTITILSRFVGSDVTKYELGSAQYVCTVLDTSGAPVSQGTSITTNIKGVIETYTADSEGKITVPLNQSPGEYTITVSYDGCDGTNDITILSRLIADDFVGYEHCNEYFGVEVLDATGVHVEDGTTVTFNVHGVSYNRTTSEGYAAIRINLDPGTYSVTVDYDSVTQISNTVTVLARLTASDLSMNFRDGSQFIATLVDCNGHPLSGETVTFNINGLITTATTDSSGQAKLTINLLPGTYIINSEYGQCSITNTITVNPSAGLTFTSSSTKNTIQIGESCTFSCSLKNNGVGISGEVIDYEITSGGTTLDSGTVTTDSNGEGDVSYTGTGAGSVTCTFSTGSLSSSVSITDASVVPDTITVTGTSVIQTGTVDILTATLLDGSTPVAGETLSYQIKHGSTVIDSGSDTTDANGQITISYTGTGVGDVDVVVSYGLLQETYEVHDCKFYDNATVDKTSSYTCNNNIALTHDTDHYVAVSSVGNNVSSNFFGLIDTGIAYQDGIIIEVDIKKTTTTNATWGIYLGNNLGVSTSNQSNYYQLSGYDSTKGLTTNPWTEKRTDGSLSNDTWYHLKLTISNGSGTGVIKQGDTTVYSDSLTYSYFSNISKICLTISQRPNTIHFKNLKIKAL